MKIVQFPINIILGFIF